MGKKNKNQKKTREKHKEKHSQGGNSMFGFGKKKEKEIEAAPTGKKQKSFGWSNWSRVNKVKPTVGKDPETLSVVLYKQSTLEEIASLCKPKAGGSEFQVHFRGIQYVIQKPGSQKRLVFTIPTVFFNMPQKVTSGSVDFNLDEIATISDEIAPISLEFGKKIDKAFPSAFFKSLGFEVTGRELEMGSIHRHPGDFGFSATDLDNQVEKPGVIFRNRGCNDKIQIDSVLYLPVQQPVKIVVTETRAVTVSPLEDGGIEGQYLETPTISYIMQDKVFACGFDDFFGGNDDSSEEIKYKVDQKWIDKKYPQIKDIFDSFLEANDYEPMLLIDPELIKQEFTSYNYGRYSRKTGFHNRSSFYYDYDGYDDFTEEDFGLESWENESDVAVGAPGQKTNEAPLERPTWRKTQTLGKLKSKYKIELKKYPEIDGSASDEDIIAIATAMKKEGYTDPDIRSLFQNCDYPKLAMQTYYRSTF